MESPPQSHRDQTVNLICPRTESQWSASPSPALLRAQGFRDAHDSVYNQDRHFPILAHNFMGKPFAPPGPRAKLLVGNLLEFRRDKLAFFARWPANMAIWPAFISAHGRWCCLSDPAMIEQVLVDAAKTLRQAFRAAACCDRCSATGCSRAKGTSGCDKDG